MNHRVKWMSIIMIISTPLAAFSASYCPKPASIHIEDGYYVATTGLGKWVSMQPAPKTNTLQYIFWQARGWPVGGVTGPKIKINKLFCAYAPTNPGPAILLKSPNYPTQTFSVERKNTDWGYFIEGYMACLKGVGSCPFNKVST